MADKQIYLSNLERFKTNADETYAPKATVDTLVGSDTGKSVRQIASAELAAQLVPANAQESLDTLAEISAWIQSHPGDAAAINAAIQALENKVDTGDESVTAFVEAAISALNIGEYALASDLTALAARVSTLETNTSGLKALAKKDKVSESDFDAALAARVQEWDDKSTFSGAYDELTGLPQKATDADIDGLFA